MCDEGLTWDKVKHKLRQEAKRNGPEVDEATPELIVKSKRILQDKDENELEDDDGIEEDDGQNCGDIFQIQIEAANVMRQGTVNVPHQIHCKTVNYIN